MYADSGLKTPDGQTCPRFVLRDASGPRVRTDAPIKAKIMYPNEAAIKTALANRTRCPTGFYEKMYQDPSMCPMPNESSTTNGFPLYGLSSSKPFGTLRGGCTIGSSQQHLPDDWANAPYVPKYELDNAIPDEAIYRWDTCTRRVELEPKIMLLAL